MQVRENHQETEGIEELRYEIEKDRFLLKWKWPKHIDMVYIFRQKGLEEGHLEQIEEKELKLYTKEEYQVFHGYIEPIKEITQYRYWVFPAVEQEEGILLLKQQDGKNEILISTGKPEVAYTIEEKKGWRGLLSREKNLQITIETEISLKKEVLCYVKKQGTFPQNKEDGICFDFIEDFPVGKSILPEITVQKNEFVKIFIKDPIKYGNAYTLKQK